MSEELDREQGKASRTSLGQQTRPRQSLKYSSIDRLDRRSAPGFGGIQNSGPSFITEHIDKILGLIALVTVLAFIGLESRTYF